MTGIGTDLTGGLGLFSLAAAGLALVLYLVPIRPWIAAWASGAYVGLSTPSGMRLRRVPPGTVVTARIHRLGRKLGPCRALDPHDWR